MTTLTDDLLLAHADRVQDKVVIVTGALVRLVPDTSHELIVWYAMDFYGHCTGGASGIGKESCILFAQYG